MMTRVTAGLAAAFLMTPAAQALDINAFRAQHKLPPLAVSGALSAAAREHASDLARRRRLDHNGFRARVGSIVSGTAAENVLVGCADEACAMQTWAKSPGHRRNMLMAGVTHYGLASASDDKGRRYWVLELGN